MDRNTFYDSLRYYQEHDINSLQHRSKNKKIIDKKDIVNESIQEIKNSKYDENQKAQKLSKAKHNKMYDRKFVEIIQNVKGLTNEQCLEEYEKYLDNPNNYSGIESDEDNTETSDE